jgi:hypothetical protein
MPGVLRQRRPAHIRRRTAAAHPTLPDSRGSTGSSGPREPDEASASECPRERRRPPRALLLGATSANGAHAVYWPAWRHTLPCELSAEAADDPIGVEGLPACRWRRLGKSPFGLDELVYEVATGRCAPERFGKLGVIDEPVRKKEAQSSSAPSVMRYTTWWTSPASWSRSLTRWVRSSMPETYAARAGRTIGTRGPLRAADPPTDTAELPPCAFCEATAASSERPARRPNQARDGRRGGRSHYVSERKRRPVSRLGIRERYRSSSRRRVR